MCVFVLTQQRTYGEFKGVTKLMDVITTISVCVCLGGCESALFAANLFRWEARGAHALGGCGELFVVVVVA